MISRSPKPSLALALGTLAAFIALVGGGVLAATPRQGSQPQEQQNQSSMAGMDMSKPGNGQDSEAAKGANVAMSGHDMEMGAHMFMTDLRPANAADEKRAAELVAELRPAIEKYKDYKVALADGFRIFFPNVRQDQYHFTNYKYGREAQTAFNPAHPTSLLYVKNADGGYTLVGAMYTAPRDFTEDQLNERVPLSVAHWHKHVNFCFAPVLGSGLRNVSSNQLFGFRGSISTEEACKEAGGHWVPQIFNWMVHVYPYETDPAKIWAHQ
jgi:hypothetical protein